jgi:hypothetical protein
VASHAWNGRGRAVRLGRSDDWAARDPAVWTTTATANSPAPQCDQGRSAPSWWVAVGAAHYPLMPLDLMVSLKSQQHVTPDFPKKIICISYVRQDKVYTHMIDVMSEISITAIKTYKS